MISSVHLSDFRICRGNLQIHENGTAYITRQVADALDLQPGDKIRYIRL